MSATISTFPGRTASPLARAISGKSTGLPAAAPALPVAAPALPASVAGGQRASAPKLRLTRRGRTVFGTLATLLVIGVLAVVAMFSGAQAVATAEGSDAEFGYVIVQPGDSLWQLAGELDENADPRDLVAEIVRLNQLESSAVQAGEPIAVPLRYSDGPGVVPASELGL